MLLGTFLLLWPGVWQEWVHPLAMGTTFYHLQRIGALWCLRGGIELWSGVRGETRLASLLSIWWVGEFFGDTLLAWRTADTGEWVTMIYGTRAVLDLGVAWLLWRCSGNKSGSR